MELSVGKVARLFGLSRATLLYYDSIGLLRPSGRSPKGYRLYNEADINRLSQVMLLRGAGVPLSEIAGLVTAGENDVAAALLKKLNDLNQQIKRIKAQQETIIRILSNTEFHKNQQPLEKASRLSILAAAGIDEEEARRWLEDFEKHSPDQHSNFLSLLNLTKDEIWEIWECFRTVKKGKEDDSDG